MTEKVKLKVLSSTTNSLQQIPLDPFSETLRNNHKLTERLEPLVLKKV